MAEPLYARVDPQVSFPELEEDVMRSWADKRVFERQLSQREGSSEWVFYEGPPTANGKPGIHHVEARAFKDLFCRFQAMRGHYVHRRAGWDCHGLPVEIEVEKQLGIKQKREIEENVGIEEFTRLCRESVQRYVEDWRKLTDRIGFWLDLDDAYWTMSPQYVESVWWLLKQIWDKGLLEEDFKVVPYCPRCETALSSHEQHYAGAYKTVSDPSVYVRFPLVDEPQTSLLVWTTTPWTLLANMAAAVGPDVDYVKVADPGRPDGTLWVAKERLADLFGEEPEVARQLKGEDLVGVRYEPPFGFVESGETGHRVRHASFVTTEDGSGIVHIAPYGEDDMTLAKRDDLPIVQMIDPTGRVSERGGQFAGLWVKDADPQIVADLDERGLLFRSETYEHAYPHCWRCSTPLLYYPRKDWYIRTSQLRAELQASNEDTNWQPPTIKHGRFGDWLASNVDWSLSRDRYWGTPLPVWRCPDGHSHCVGSFAELSELTGQDLSEMDPHRPYVDGITFDCPVCGQATTRVTSVIDAWFDSGAMPFAQWHYPFENEDAFEKRFPADFISEAIDQTRGWFYSLLAIATLIRGQNSYRNCVVLGLLVDGEGRKMSKSLGNVLDPWTVLDAQGADAVRWNLLTGGNPWSARRMSVDIVQEVLRKYLLTLWNTYSFWVTYASIEGFDPTGLSIPVHERSEMDRWILAELDDTIRTVTSSLDEFDPAPAGRRLDRFVDDLSNWYVRRSRRRFWRSGEETDTKAAFLTLWECLVTVAKLTAPFTPFVADALFTNLTRPDASAPESVHLADWPEPDGTRVDDGLRRRMGLVRRLVTLGRSARTDAKLRVRQPLATAWFVVPAHEHDDFLALRHLLEDELNVKSVQGADTLGELVTYTVKPNFKSLGPRFGARVKDVAAALQAADAAELVASLDSSGAASIPLGDEEVELTRDDLDVRVDSRTGYAFAQDGPYGVALDTELTTELVAEGTAREVVRAIQDLRKSAGLEVSDRIRLFIHAEGPGTQEAIEAHKAFIEGEVLAESTDFAGDAPGGAATETLQLDGQTISIALEKS